MLGELHHSWQPGQADGSAGEEEGFEAHLGCDDSATADGASGGMSVGVVLATPMSTSQSHAAQVAGMPGVGFS